MEDGVLPSQQPLFPRVNMRFGRRMSAFDVGSRDPMHALGHPASPIPSPSGPTAAGHSPASPPPSHSPSSPYAPSTYDMLSPPPTPTSSPVLPAHVIAEPGRRVPSPAALFRRRVSLDDARGAGMVGSPNPMARRKMSVGVTDHTLMMAGPSRSLPSILPHTSTSPSSSRSPSLSPSSSSPAAGSSTMVCTFGGNEYGQLGRDGVLMHTEPLPIDTLENVVYVSAGWTANIALTCVGGLHCWGTLKWPGSEDRTPWTFPTRIEASHLRSVKQIVLGKNHALLLTASGEVYSFGDGKWGKLGNGTTKDEGYPAKIGFDLANVKVEQIAAGEDHSVVLTQSGEVYTFGKGSNGQLGHGNRNDCSQPTKVRQLAKKKNKMRHIAAGFDQTLCISTEGEVYSFGKAGPWLGYDVRQALVTVPKRVNSVKSLKKITSAAVGQSHTLLLTQSGEVYSMGDNKNGSLGLGERVEKTSDPMPVEALQGHNIRQISAGAEHSLALSEDGHVFSWGLAATGRLGCDDTLSNVYIPQQVLGIEGRPLAISAGLQHSVVLTAPTLAPPEDIQPTSPRRRKSVAAVVSDDSISPSDSSVEFLISDVDRRTRSLDRSGGSGSDSPSTNSGSGGIDTLRRGVKKATAVRKRLTSFGSSNKDKRRGSVSNNASPISPTNSSSSRYEMVDDDSDQVPYMYQHHQQQRVDYGYFAQAEMIRSRLLASHEQQQANQRNHHQRMNLTRSAPATLLDPKVEALLRELNYHEDDSITSLFIEGKISYEALKTFNKADLAEMGLPFGPRTALWNLLQRSTSPDVSQDIPLSPTQNGVRARIVYEDLNFQCKLGTGAFGDVWKGKLRGTTTVAIKTLKANGDYQNFRVEAQIMAELPAHANVVTFYGVADADKGLYIVTEFVPDGSLDKYLMENKEKMEQDVLVQMIKDVAAGMDHLATHGIVHRDLAARNLLLEVKRSGYHRVKVCDFGLALERAVMSESSPLRMRDGPTEEQDQQQQRLSNVPVRWSAIEVLLHGRYTTKSDVWSFGVTVWEIFSYGQTPYADLSTFEIVDLLLRGYKLPRPEKCPEELYEKIILRCLADDPDERPTFHEIYHTMESLYPTIYASSIVRLPPRGDVPTLHRSAPVGDRKQSISSFVPRLDFQGSTPTSPESTPGPASPRLCETSVFSPYGSVEMQSYRSRGSSDAKEDEQEEVSGSEDALSPYATIQRSASPLRAQTSDMESSEDDSDSDDSSSSSSDSEDEVMMDQGKKRVTIQHRIRRQRSMSDPVHTHLEEREAKQAHDKLTYSGDNLEGARMKAKEIENEREPKKDRKGDSGVSNVRIVCKRALTLSLKNKEKTAKETKEERKQRKAEKKQSAATKKKPIASARRSSATSEP